MPPELLQSTLKTMPEIIIQDMELQLTHNRMDLLIGHLILPLRRQFMFCMLALAECWKIPLKI